jgi:hypothetical protein
MNDLESSLLQLKEQMIAMETAEHGRHEWKGTSTINEMMEAAEVRRTQLRKEIRSQMDMIKEDKQEIEWFTKLRSSLEQGMKEEG